MKSVRMIIPIVLNRKYGGFSLNDEECNLIADRKGCIYDHDTKSFTISGKQFYAHDIERNDIDLVHVIKDLSEKPGFRTGLTIANAMITIEIDSFDGYETINIRGFGEYKE